MNVVIERQKQIPVVWEGDLCVLGGSATGVFAAVRAARLGLKVVLVEKQNCFGGTATSGLVDVWHSMYDFDRKDRIVAGLSQEVIDRIPEDYKAISRDSNYFNPIAMVEQLDRLVLAEPNIHPLLHTFYAGCEVEDDAVAAVYIQNKDGRSALRASMVIDATGDGDLMRDIGVEAYRHEKLQPPSSCFFLKGNTTNELVSHLIKEHGQEFGLDDDWGWFAWIPGLRGMTFRADFHVFDLDLSRAEDLTKAEFEGRRKAFAFEKLLKKYVSPEYSIVNLCSAIGIRETVHYRTRYCSTEKDLLEGARFDDAILQGTYRVDIHHANDNGITFKDLNGQSLTLYGKSERAVRGNWRKEAGLDDNYSRFYQAPFSILVQEKFKNVLLAGRMVNAEEGAFGALRVMLNTNQMGEAAGVGAYLAVTQGKTVQQLEGREVRKVLVQGGSAL